jgi:hypothetical protein
MIDAEYARSRLAYCPLSGRLVWKHWDRARPQWNGRHAGKVAGTPNGPAHISVVLDGKHYLAHRLAWLITYGELPPGEIDHVNGDSVDNRIANLRLADRTQNARNIGPRKNNVLGVKGVRRLRGRFIAECTVDRKAYYLGSFATVAEASIAYNQFASEAHGSFFRPSECREIDAASVAAGMAASPCAVDLRTV